MTGCAVGQTCWNNFSSLFYAEGVAYSWLVYYTKQMHTKYHSEFECINSSFCSLNKSEKSQNSTIFATFSNFRHWKKFPRMLSIAILYLSQIYKISAPSLGRIIQDILDLHLSRRIQLRKMYKGAGWREITKSRWPYLNISFVRLFRWRHWCSWVFRGQVRKTCRFFSYIFCLRYMRSFPCKTVGTASLSLGFRTVRV